MIQIVEDFFDDFQFLKEAFKKVPLYNVNTYNKKFNKSDSWPGLRSEELFDSEPFLAFYFLKHFKEKFPTIDYRKYTIHLHLHLRLKEDQEKDWIHTDSCKYSFLAYLSETNYDSGTLLYDKINNQYFKKAEINFIQNRAFVFDADQLHKSKLNHGNSIDNGRLTLNAFLY